METGSKLSLSTSPFLHDGDTTPGIMYHVVWAILPVIGAAYFFFGLSAILLCLSATAGCVLAERMFHGSVKDGSVLITGLLLALTLPPGFPIWMAFTGGVVSIAIGKAVWGGLGQNLFNPALVGRAFLQAAFPTAITTWSPPDGRYLTARGSNLAWPFMHSEEIDAVTSATPLAQMKFEQVSPDWVLLSLGATGGSLGETCGVIILLSGIYMALRKVLNWHIPVSILLSTFLAAGTLYGIDPAVYPSPVHMIFSGGLLLGAIFMATDPVTSPYTPTGCWIFGVGIGLLVVLIRVFGGLPEGVMYAILLMNGLTPLINRVTRSRVYGVSR